MPLEYVEQPDDLTDEQEAQLDDIWDRVAQMENGARPRNLLAMDNTLNAGFDPNQPRDWHGRWGSGGYQSAHDSDETVSAPSPQLWGQQPTSVLRWMGKQGYTFAEAKAAMWNMGVPVRDNTVKSQLSYARTGRGDLADITPEQAAILERAKTERINPGPDPDPEKTKARKGKPRGEKPPKPDPKPDPGKKGKQAKGAPAHLSLSREPTAFTKKVWDKIKSLPDGKVTSYQEAMEVGKVLREELHDRLRSLNKEFDRGLGRRETIGSYFTRTQEKHMEALRSAETPQASYMAKIAADEEALAMDAIAGGEAWKLLAEVRDLGPTKKPNLTGSTAARKILTEGMTKLPAEWMDRVADLHLNVRKVRRGYWGANSRIIPLQPGTSHRIAMSGLSPKSQQGCAVHELMHAVQYTHPTIVHIEQEFMKHRIATTPNPADAQMRSVNGLRERGVKDKFLCGYSGRYYGPSWHGTRSDNVPPYLEIMTTAVQSLEGERVGGIHGDHEWLDFTLGILAGT